MPADLVVDPASTLFFLLADADESPEPRNQDDEDEEDENGQEEAEGGDHQDEQNGHGDTGAEDGDNENNENDYNEEDKNDDEDGDEEKDKDAPREPLDLTVRLVDAGGEVAEIPLSRFSYVQPQLEVELSKTFFDDPERQSEPVSQRFAFPLAWFVEVNPALDATRIHSLEFVFDRTEKGVVIIDSVGFRPPIEGS
jgi:hypothetical protein